MNSSGFGKVQENKAEECQAKNHCVRICGSKTGVAECVLLCGAWRTSKTSRQRQGRPPDSGEH